MSEPREYSVFIDPKYGIKLPMANAKGDTIVIEKSAFTELQAELKDVRHEMKMQISAMSRLNALQAQADKLQKTLGMVTCVGSPYDKIIMEALSNYAKFKTGLSDAEMEAYDNNR